MKRHSIAQAFTLIELLIVVAIIAILAAIAVPNFIEAQTRAKVSRVVNDLRTIATALEAYDVDYNAYPLNDGYYNVIPCPLTTPVSYIVDSNLIDPFCNTKTDPVYGNLARNYTYGKVVTQYEFLQDELTSHTPPIEIGHTPPVEMIDMPGYNEGAFQKYGPWRLVSNGPDGIYSSHSFMDVDPILLGSDIPYDPTNGTVSWGNILRTQRSVTGQVNPSMNMNDE